MPAQPEDDEHAWRGIVDHYGERAELSSADLQPPTEVDARHEIPYDDDAGDAAADRFVPPVPPPVPRPRGARLVAWLGVATAPLALLVAVLTPLRISASVAYPLVGWFVGSFAYLVLTMPSNQRESWDDGAQI
jgi:hypothetical protein